MNNTELQQKIKELNHHLKTANIKLELNDTEASIKEYLFVIKDTCNLVY